MFQGKLRKVTLILLALYTLLTLFFLFLGFSRSSNSGDTALRFNLTFEGIPLRFPSGSNFDIWFFDLGNFIAFIPFGVVVPLLYRVNFIRFIAGFILSITFIETMQMVTRLGSFDINDIIINTLGAAVGYVSQRIITKDRDSVRGIIKIILTAIACGLITILSVASINHYFKNSEGEAVALHEFALQDGNAGWDEELVGFTSASEQIEPQINLYSKSNPKTNEFTVSLSGEYEKVTGYAAIPDEVIKGKGQGRSAIHFIGDGKEIYSIEMQADAGLNGKMSFQVPVNGTKELTIKIINDHSDPDTNIVMWDVVLTKKHQILKRIKNDT
ncbi:VanZ family protein [Paenibacillus senegalensis]|uniref:VanZ family protein n=1 Tax=Paenibacillus senegalensis TaxID=1465766 RepID=UPI000288F5EA|nr:VanZ family protein [Paenibacillus senegalensis]